MSSRPTPGVVPLRALFSTFQRSLSTHILRWSFPAQIFLRNGTVYLEQLECERRLCSFQKDERTHALSSLREMLAAAQVPVVPELPAVNLHCHTFFSFNAYGYSPAAYAWEAKKRGLYAAGIVDFDVLDGVEEFLASAELLGLRALAGMESRVVVPEWRDRDINSPGEPGICYFMGSGFTEGSPELRLSSEGLGRMHALAQGRNRVMLDKLNRYLGKVRVDYEEDVLPLTPSGNPTERHMLVALYRRSLELFPQKPSRARFWAEALNMKPPEIVALDERPVELQMLIRAKLMKRGGPGYTAPDHRSFPSLDEMIALVKELGGVPTHTWLDGMSDCESDAPELLDFMIEKGSACLNIVPDRNWNLRDSEERSRKRAKLYQIVEEAGKRDLPIIVGTEMNKNGQRFVDDFHAQAMGPVCEAFLRGARIMTGHTSLKRSMGIGLLDEEVVERFGKNRKAANLLFECVGELAPARTAEEREDVNRAIKSLWERRDIS
jgi:hypothetical protein